VTSKALSLAAKLARALAPAAQAAAPAAALLLVGVAAFAMLKWVPLGSERDPKARGGKDELAVWELLITGEVVVWALFAVIGFRMLKTLGDRLPGALPDRRWSRETAEFLFLVYGAVALLLGLGGVAKLASPTVLQGQQWKSVVLYLVAGVAIFPFLVALKRIQLCAEENASWSLTTSDIELHRLLRRHLRTATMCLGAIVALAVVATGALRQAVEGAKLDPLPETFVILYGAWFTAVLAAIYLYVFGALEKRGRRIVNDAAPRKEHDLRCAQDDDATNRRRKSLSEELELGGDPRKNLEGLVAVFSPLIGALLSQLGGL
jgi:hypothetical protein